ncbi:MAG: DUF2516 family protein [Actinomycetales bacterium]|nr:DUF2516 family protein [Actinomycetales bacterium]
MFDFVQGLVTWILWAAFLGIKGFALVDCVRRPSAAFPAVSRQSKVLWLVITGLATLTGLLPSMTLSLIGFAGLAGALFYLFDVRRRITDLMGR